MPNIIDHERTEFQKHTGVSHETIHRLDRYAELLREWNQKFNLVAESTLPHIWSRHFLDSAQLMRFIPERTEILADLGSGAGFPGLVLSILGVPGVHLDREPQAKRPIFFEMSSPILGFKQSFDKRELKI